MTEIALTGELTSASTSSKEKQKDGPNAKMAGILPGLQASIAQLAKSLELQTETLQSLKEDLLLRSDNKESDETSAENESTSGNTPDVESTIDAVLNTSSNNSANAASGKASHPLGKKLKLLACLVSGKAPSREAFQMQLPQLSCSHGQTTPISNISHISRNGSSFAVDGKVIHMTPL